METVVLKQIGYIETPYTDYKDTPLCGQGICETSIIHIYPEYANCLDRLHKEQYIFVFSWLDKAERNTHVVHPRRNPENDLQGVFATRSPSRPNPIAYTILKLEKIEGTKIYVHGSDLFNNTPVLDIKPYYPPVDNPVYKEQ